MKLQKDISIIRVPLWYGSDKQGVDYAPKLLSVALEKEYSSAIAQTIDVSVPSSQQELSEVAHEKHLDSIVRVNRNLAQVVTQQLSINRFVLTIGGDHAIGLGTVSGSLQFDENIGLIWFDAHGDMNTETTSPTGNIHGMPVAALMGLCETELNNVPRHHINPRNIFWIGARDLDAGEKELTERLHLNVYSTERIHEVGMNTVLKDVKTKMEQQGIKNIHLSFDVDAFDPQLFPATGVKVQNGLWMDDFETFVNHIPTLPRMIAIDFVEYNPLMDNAAMDCKHKSILFIEQLLRVNAL